MISTENPFNALRLRLWEVLESSAFFEEFVRQGNRIRYDNELGEKATIGHGDLVEIVLIPTEYSRAARGDSHNVYITASYQFYITTGSKDVRKVLALQWELLRVLETFSATLDSLIFDGREIGVRADITSGTQGVSDDPRNRQISGWIASWGVACDICVPMENVYLEGVE